MRLVTVEPRLPSLSMSPFFSPEDRERARNHVLELARSDPRVVSGAVVGSAALGEQDRWSDLDLTFGLGEDVTPSSVLEDWTDHLASDCGAVHLFDLPSHTSVYRVFLFPGNLQVDLSVTPGFSAQYGPGFKLLFGSAHKSVPTAAPSARDTFGYAAHHAVRGRFSVERGRLWQGEFWINDALHETLSLGCLRRGLNPSHGRGFDRLPPDVLAVADECLVRRVERGELLRALGSTIDFLIDEAVGAVDAAARLGSQLRDLARNE